MSIAIPVIVEVEYTRREEDVFFFSVSLDILGTPEGQFHSEVATDAFEHPQVSGHGRDDFGLPADLQDRLTVAVYQMALPYLANPEPHYPSAITIADPDLRPWIEATFYLTDASRLIRLLSAKVNPKAEILLTQRTTTARID